MDYLRSQGVDTSCWEEYGTLYMRYYARIKKYHPENYQQFLNLCCFSKQRKKYSGEKDLGDYERELYYQSHKVPKGLPKAKIPKAKDEFKEEELEEPKIKEPKEPFFNEARWIKDEIKEWDQYKLRMKHYREDKIRNFLQTEKSEKAKMKDFPPYLFKFAMKCLSGTLRTAYLIATSPEAVLTILYESFK